MAFHLHKPHEFIRLKCDNATFLATLDGNRCRTETRLHQEISEVLRFPEHYGKNFDAMYDCLTDLEWLGVDAVYLLIIHPALICSDEENHTEGLFQDVMRQVLEDYRHHPIHFHLISEKSFLNLIEPHFDK